MTVEGAQTDAGRHTATATALTNPNYALPENSTVEFTIAKAAGEIRFAESALTKQYGDEAFTAELTNSGDGQVSYTSGSPSVAAVDADTGEITIIGTGTAVITATVADGDNYSYATKTAAFTLTVNPKAAELRFAESAVSRVYGSKAFVNALTNTGDGTVTYTSDNTAVATVDPATGTVTIAGAGEATITATATGGTNSVYAENTASYRLTVRKADNPGFASGSTTVNVGADPLDLMQYVRYAVGTVSWAIRGEALGCTVSEDGSFTPGDEPGTVTVTVTMAGDANTMEKSVDMVVNVVEKPTRYYHNAVTRQYGDPLDLPIQIPVPDGETPSIHYTGTTRGDVTWDSAEAPSEAGNYTAMVTYEDKDSIWIEPISIRILPRELGRPEVTLGEALIYNGSEQTQTVVAVKGLETDVPAGEYTITDNTGTDAGTYTMTITAKPTGNYTGSFTKDFTISKADPAYTIPEGLTADVGGSLADVVLPAGWSWANSSLSVGNEVGPQTFKANFTPADTKNYNTIENIDVPVTVMASAAFVRVKQASRLPPRTTRRLWC